MMPLLIAANVQAKEIHFPGEPWALVTMDRIPNLRTIAKEIRDSFEVTNKTLSDIDFQNEENYESFIELLNTDIVFRLTFTHEYYLLANLFKDPKEKARFIKFLNELHAHERDHTRELQESTLLIIRVNSKKIPLYPGTFEPMFLFTHPHPSLSHTERWQHYEGELQRITFEYHRQRIDIQSRSVQRCVQLLGSVIDVLKEREPYTKGGIEALQVLQMDFEKRKQAIDNIPLYSPDGEFDAEAAARQDEEMESLQKDITSQVEGIVKASGHDDPAINALRTMHEQAKEKEAMDLNVIDSAFAEQKASIMTHLKQARTASKQQVIASLDEFLGKLKKCVVDEHQQDNIDRLIETIENYKERLGLTDDFESVEALLNECKIELSQLPHMLSKSTYTLLKDEISSLGKMIGTPDIVIEAVAPSVQEVHQEEEFIPQGHAAAFPAPSAPPLPEVVYRGQDEASDVPKSPQKISPQSASYALDRQRATVHNYKTSIRLLDDPQRTSIIFGLKTILLETNKLLDDIDCDPEIRALAQELQGTIEQIEPFISHSQEAPEELQIKFSEQLKALGEINNDFNKLNEQYEDLFAPNVGFSP